MAVLTPKTLYIGQGNGATANTIYTANSTAGNYTIIKSINICNANTTTVKNINMNIVPTAGSPAETNLYLSNLSIPANTAIQIDTSLILSNSYFVSINHTGNVTVIMTGVEFV